MSEHNQPADEVATITHQKAVLMIGYVDPETGEMEKAYSFPHQLNVEISEDCEAEMFDAGLDVREELIGILWEQFAAKLADELGCDLVPRDEEFFEKAVDHNPESSEDDSSDQNESETMKWLNSIADTGSAQKPTTS